MAHLYERLYAPGPHNNWEVYDPLPPPNYTSFTLNAMDHDHHVGVLDSGFSSVAYPTVVHPLPGSTELAIRGFPDKGQFSAFRLRPEEKEWIKILKDVDRESGLPEDMNLPSPENALTPEEVELGRARLYKRGEEMHGLYTDFSTASGSRRSRRGTGSAAPGSPARR